MSNLNPDNVLDEFSEDIPNAHELGVAYLRAVAQRVDDNGIPVGVELQTQPRFGGGFGAEPSPVLVLAPDDERLRPYPSYHYARPLGTTLNVGWYLVGKIAAGRIGRYSRRGHGHEHDMDDLGALVHVIQQVVVVPAMDDIAAVAGSRRDRTRRSERFFRRRP